MRPPLLPTRSARPELAVEEEDRQHEEGDAGDAQHHQILGRAQHPPQHDVAQGLGGPDPLTARELEVLRLVAQGLSNQEIAERLAVSERTARTHVSQILTKLHLANRTQAALYALREGLAGADSP